MSNCARFIVLLMLGLTAGCQSARKLPVAIESQQLQVVYVGLTNPVNYVYHGVRCEDLIMVCDTQKARIKKGEDCAFNIVPLVPSKDGITVSIYRKKVDPGRLLEKRKLKSVGLPLPEASLNGNTGPYISTGALKAVKVISSVMSGFVFEGYRYRVSAFDYLLVKGSNKTVIDRGHAEGQAIPAKVRKAFNSMEKGDMIHFYNIEARAIHGKTVRTANDLSLWIR